MVHLNNIWFVIVAIFWVGFFVLEGFDFGVGMLHSFVGRNDVERRIAVNSIGPIWDGNEVWLDRGRGGHLRRLPVVVRHHVLHLLPGPGDRPGGPHRARRLLRVPPQDRQPPLAGHLAVVAHHRQRRSSRCCSARPSATCSTGCPSTPPTTTPAASGACWSPSGSTPASPSRCCRCSSGPPTSPSRPTARSTNGAPASRAGSGWLAAVVTFGWLTWIHVGLSVGFVPNPIDALALVGIVAAAWLAESRSEGWAFAAAAVAIGSVVASIFFELFPRVMVSSTNAAYNLTIANSASPSYTLKVMTVVAAIVLPVVLAYQGWSLWVFRKRLTTPPSADAGDTGGTGAGPPTVTAGSDEVPNLGGATTGG